MECYPIRNYKVARRYIVRGQGITEKGSCKKGSEKEWSDRLCVEKAPRPDLVSRLDLYTKVQSFILSFLETQERI